MWFYRVALRHLYWSAAVLKKFFKLVPLPTLTLVVLTLVSQFSRMLAFFLPLKVIILIGSTGTPRYFPDSWAALDRDALVIALSLATVFFYAASLSSERLLSFMAERGAAGVVAGTHKLVLFTNQDEVASQAYQKLAAGLATGTLAAVLILLFALVYPGFLFAIISYVLAASAFVALLGHRVEARGELQQKAGSLIGLISGIGFMMLFAFMVVDFLLWEGVSFMVALISLLLSRQLLNRLDGVLKDAIWLSDKRLQINAIFFTGHRLEKMPEHTRNRRFWSLLCLCENCDQLLRILAQVKGHALVDGVRVQCRWKQSGLADLLAFDVEVKAAEEEAERYLLKIFGKRHRKAAMSEVDILSSVSSHLLPAPELVYIGDMEGFDVHLLRLSEGYVRSSWLVRRVKNEWLAEYWKVEPDKALLNRYLRSHPLLPHRLGSWMMERLDTVAVKEVDRSNIENLRFCFDEVLAELNLLPLVICNVSAPKDLVLLSEAGALCAAHWGEWSIEPVGAEVSRARGAGKSLRKALLRAAKDREVLAEVPLERFYLCVLCGVFEKFFQRQRYADAIALLPDLLRCLSHLKNGSDIGKDSLVFLAAGVGEDNE
ncbi:hypothetical protein [Billgrantia ethanolica]|uniref:Uncharacterized protein n=1 Tax=Billgrantia ethanolica TaxID=2733486 RepID=A0ABS9A1N7_9GAMM|nr:hypothetical protein [Halomonas ethanolica]MCE8002213.1 hypothetical protein [Halomonas ethanolica]